MATIIPKRNPDLLLVDGGTPDSTGTDIVDGGSPASTGAVIDGGGPSMTFPLLPTAVNGFTSSREVPTIVHPVIGKSTPLITIRAGQLRTGTLELWFHDEDESLRAETEHARGFTMQLISGRDTVDMYYVAAGRIERTRDRGAWIVRVDYVEVTPELSYDDLDAVFASYDDMDAAFASYDDRDVAWEYTGAAVT